MTISIITVCLNEAKSISASLESVKKQSYSNIEHIIVDGGSTDDTWKIAEEYAQRAAYPVKVIHQQSDSGIYGALNEGISYANGDVIATLHANDMYETDDELAQVAKAFMTSDADLVYGDVRYFRAQRPSLTVRKYSAKHFCRKSLLDFFAPPHPATFIKRNIFLRHGLYATDYLIAADFELMVRLILVNRVKTLYVERCIVAMSMGGLSTSLRHILFTNIKEKRRALRQNNQKCRWISILKRYLYTFKH